MILHEVTRIILLGIVNRRYNIIIIYYVMLQAPGIKEFLVQTNFTFFFTIICNIHFRSHQIEIQNEDNFIII